MYYGVIKAKSDPTLRRISGRWPQNCIVIYDFFLVNIIDMFEHVFTIAINIYTTTFIPYFWIISTSIL